MYQIRCWTLNFWASHEVLKLCSWSIRAPKYVPIFNEVFKFLVKNFHTWFLKQSMFEASEALLKQRGQKKIPSLFIKFWSRNNLGYLFSSLISWTHKTSTLLPPALGYRWKTFFSQISKIFHAKSENKLRSSRVSEKFVRNVKMTRVL